VAPTLFDPTAVPTQLIRDMLGDSRDLADEVAKVEKFAVWLHSKLTETGLKVDGPFADQGAWVMGCVNSKRASELQKSVIEVDLETVLNNDECLVYAGDTGGHFNITVLNLVGDPKGLKRVVETVLSGSNEVTEWQAKS
jgi:hypothetical protein